MTWLDIVFIFVWIIFLAVGARLGSLWTGSCLIGGFLGSILVDTYALPLSTMIGGFQGSHIVSMVLLFLGGLACGLIPGWLLSRVSSFLFLGILDSGFGFITGGLTGFVAIALILLLVVPLFPKVERSKPWRDSVIVKPLHHFLEQSL